MMPGTRRSCEARSPVPSTFAEPRFHWTPAFALVLGSMRCATIAIGLGLASLSGGVAAQKLRADAPNHLPSTAPAATSAYGADPLQVGDLRLPAGAGPFPVAVIIHGGCWTKGFATRRHTAAMATALTNKGVATWNIEYRQLGEEGAGWPGTFLDWGAATDHLRVLARTYPLDLSRIVVTGHSAGAHAALFVASRPRLPAASAVRGADPLPVKGAVAIDGPGDLPPFVGQDAKICGKPVIEPLMGGTPDTVAERYGQGSPAASLPLGVRQALVSTSRVLTPEAAEAYRSAAAKAGDKVDVLVMADSGHFEPIAPGTREWSAVEALIVEFAGAAEQK